MQQLKTRFNSSESKMFQEGSALQHGALYALGLKCTPYFELVTGLDYK